MRIKVVGAGSAGLHHAHAARQLGWSVDVVDVDESALARFPDVYAERYGHRANGICLYDHNPLHGHQLVVIATPPESHIELALRENCPVLIEKPLCAPHQVEEAEQLLGRKAYVGYCHVLGEAVRPLHSLDVEWRESWDFVMAAHKWLSSPDDTYLGSWERGGGPAWEHSHGLNLWQHLARRGGQGEAVGWHGSVDSERFEVELVTETGFRGKVTQDVTTKPAIKRALVNGFEIKPMRAFKLQLQHVAEARPNSPIDVKHGLSTARILASIRPRSCEQPSGVARARDRDNQGACQGVPTPGVPGSGEVPVS